MKTPTTTPVTPNELADMMTHSAVAALHRMALHFERGKGVKKDPEVAAWIDAYADRLEAETTETMHVIIARLDARDRR